MPRLSRLMKKAIQVVQAARYLRVESELRAVVRFEQAAQVPRAR